MDRNPLTRRWLSRLGLACLVVVVALPGSPGVGADSAPRALVLTQRLPLPEARSVPTDIRWASDDSVFVSWDRDGVAEMGLDGTKRRALVPHLKTLGGIQHYSQLAVTSRALAVASHNWAIAWRPLKANPRREFFFQKREIPLTNDFDLAGDRILLLGIHKREEPYMPKGEVAWLGTLSAKLEDLKPVLHDKGGAGAPNYWKCRFHDLGAVRFLADGSFMIAPGSLDGIHLYDAGGRKVRSWANAQVGLDTHLDCPRIRDEAKEYISLAGWTRFLNGHHVLDDILPLPQGPGLLVRSWGSDGQARWILKVLRPEGIEEYAVPVVGRRTMDRLHGDVRNGKIVLLLSASGAGWSTDREHYGAEILSMELPRGEGL